MQKEIWKDTEFAGYMVSNLGNVKSLDREGNNNKYTRYIIKGNMSDIKNIFPKKNIFVVIMFVLCLCSCNKTTPTTAIVNHHLQLVEDTIDYAKNNMSDDGDIKMLINSLKTCGVALKTVEQTYYSEISTCEAKTSYWRLASISLFLALCLSIFIIIKKVF